MILDEFLREKNQNNFCSAINQLKIHSSSFVWKHLSHLFGLLLVKSLFQCSFSDEIENLEKNSLFELILRPTSKKYPAAHITTIIRQVDFAYNSMVAE